MRTKTRKVKVRVYDSLGHIVSEYETKIDLEKYNRLLAISDDDSGMATVECRVDDEEGYKEYLL